MLSHIRIAHKNSKYETKAIYFHIGYATKIISVYLIDLKIENKTEFIQFIKTLRAGSHNLLYCIMWGTEIGCSEIAYVKVRVINYLVPWSK